MISPISVSNLNIWLRNWTSKTYTEFPTVLFKQLLKFFNWVTIWNLSKCIYRVSWWMWGKIVCSDSRGFCISIYRLQVVFHGLWRWSTPYTVLKEQCWCITLKHPLDFICCFLSTIVLFSDIKLYTTYSTLFKKNGGKILDRAMVGSRNVGITPIVVGFLWVPDTVSPV